MKRNWKTAYHRVTEILDEFHLDTVAAYSARATLFIIISFFPFMIMLLSLLQFLPFSSDNFLGEKYSEIFLEFIPATIRDLVVAMVDEIETTTGAAVLPVAAITALWSASTGMLSLMKGLNAVYGRKETRNYFLVRGISALYTVIFIFILLAVLLVLVFGNSLYQWIKQLFPFLQNGISTIISLRAIASVIILTLFFTILYKTVPNGSSRWFAELPGALLSAVAWMSFSYLYSLYIDTMGTFSRIYGSLTAVVLLLIWLYACMYIVFIGAQINVMLQKGKLGRFFIKRGERSARFGKISPKK